MILQIGEMSCEATLLCEVKGNQGNSKYYILGVIALSNLNMIHRF